MSKLSSAGLAVIYCLTILAKIYSAALRRNKAERKIKIDVYYQMEIMFPRISVFFALERLAARKEGCLNTARAYRSLGADGNFGGGAESWLGLFEQFSGFLSGALIGLATVSRSRLGCGLLLNLYPAPNAKLRIDLRD